MIYIKSIRIGDVNINKKMKIIVLVGEVIVEHVNHFGNYIQLLRHHQVETKMLEDYLRARQKKL